MMLTAHDMLVVSVVILAALAVVMDFARRVGTYLIDHYFTRRRQLAKDYAATLGIEPGKGEG